MLIMEFKRTFMKHKTIVMNLVQVGIGCLSLNTIYQSTLDKIEFINHPPVNSIEPVDLLIIGFQEKLLHSNGFLYFIEFIHHNFFQELSVILLLLMGRIFYAPTINRRIKSGYENQVKVRTSYRKHLCLGILTQLLSFLLVVWLSNLIIAGLAIAMNGFKISPIVYEGVQISFGVDLVIIGMNTILVAFFVGLAVVIVGLLNAFIKRNNILSILPLILFWLTPMILSASLVEVRSTLAKFMNLFNPSTYVALFPQSLTNIFAYKQSYLPNFNFNEFFRPLIVLGSLRSIVIILFFTNSKIYEDNLL